MAAPTIRVGNNANYKEPVGVGASKVGWADQRTNEPLSQVKEIPQDETNKKTQQIPGATPNHPLESNDGRFSSSN